jgi:hypothetical protein
MEGNDEVAGCVPCHARGQTSLKNRLQTGFCGESGSCRTAEKFPQSTRRFILNLLKER